MVVLRIRLKTTAWDGYNIAFILIVLFFLFLKTQGLRYAAGDGNIYFYMGKLIAEGKMPYGDFFYAHPPLPVFIFAIIFKIFGFNFLLLKSVPIIAITVSSIFLYGTVRENMGKRESILAVMLFLFSYDLLRASTHPTGVNVTLMFMMISTYLFFSERYLKSGFFLGLASISGLYSLILFPPFFIYLFLRDREGMKSFIFSFILVFGIVNLALLYLYEDNYLTPVYEYHGLKPGNPSHNAAVFSRVLGMNYQVFLTALLIIFFVRKLNKKLILNLSIAILYLLFLVTLSKVYDFYFILAFPYLAILGSYSLNGLSEVNGRVYGVIALLLLISYIPTIERYNMHEERFFEKADEISSYVRQNSDTGQTIFGDSASTPLIALLSERYIALDCIDTNVMRFRSNVTDINSVLNQLKATENFKFFIGRGKTGIYSMKEVREYLEENCKPAMKFRDRYKGVFYIYDCSHVVQ